MSLSPLLFYRKYKVREELKDLLKYVWVMRSKERESQQDLLIPDGYPEIIFVLRGAYRKAYLHPDKEALIINESCLVGIQTQTVLANRLNHCHLIGIKLKPAGAYTLLGEKLQEIADANENLNSCDLPWLKHLNHQILQTPSDYEAIRLIENSLLAQLGNSPVDERAYSFIHTILTEKGQLSVQELAAEHQLSIRQLQRRFKGYFGISPKKFISLIRFKHYYKQNVLRHEDRRHFLDYGYYDQMHFIRDFQKHLGITPSRREDSTFQLLNQMARINS